jgi:hypothetical protein
MCYVFYSSFCICNMICLTADYICILCQNGKSNICANAVAILDECNLRTDEVQDATRCNLCDKTIDGKNYDLCTSCNNTYHLTCMETNKNSYCISTNIRFSILAEYTYIVCCCCCFYCCSLFRIKLFAFVVYQQRSQNMLLV